MRQIVADVVYAFNKEFPPAVNYQIMDLLTDANCRAQFAVLYYKDREYDLEFYSHDKVKKRPVKWVAVKDPTDDKKRLKHHMPLRKAKGNTGYGAFFFRRVDVPKELPAVMYQTCSLFVCPLSHLGIFLSMLTHTPGGPCRG